MATGTQKKGKECVISRHTSRWQVTMRLQSPVRPPPPHNEFVVSGQTVLCTVTTSVWLVGVQWPCFGMCLACSGLYQQVPTFVQKMSGRVLAFLALLILKNGVRLIALFIVVFGHYCDRRHN